MDINQTARFIVDDNIITNATNFIINNCQDLQRDYREFNHCIDWQYAVKEFDFNNGGNGYHLIKLDPSNTLSKVEQDIYCITDNDGGYIYQWYSDRMKMVQDFYYDEQGTFSDIEAPVKSYWFVSDWLMGELTNVGQTVVVVDGINVWGAVEDCIDMADHWAILAIAEKI